MLPDPTPRERIVVFLLRLGAAILLLAFGAMVMPTAWMAANHEWLGLGPFPDRPVVDYLTRSIAALYGFHGVLLLIVSTDVRRLRPIVAYLAWMNVVFGPLLMVIDLRAGLPWWWTAAEGPGVLAFGLVLFRLLPDVQDGDSPR